MEEERVIFLQHLAGFFQLFDSKEAVSGWKRLLYID
jgi:hypothetical protein